MYSLSMQNHIKCFLFDSIVGSVTNIIILLMDIYTNECDYKILTTSGSISM